MGDKEKLLNRVEELRELLEKSKDILEPLCYDMVNRELKYAKTVLTHVVESDDQIQIEHYTCYLDEVESFLNNKIFNKPVEKASYHMTTLCALTDLLVNHRSEMELKYSSIAVAELNVAEKVIYDSGNLIMDDNALSAHVKNFLHNTDRLICTVLNLNDPTMKQKK